MNGRRGTAAGAGAGFPVRDPGLFARFYAVAAALQSADGVEGVLKQTVHAARSLARADRATLTVLCSEPGAERVLWSGYGAAGGATLEREVLVRERPFAVLHLAAARRAFAEEEQRLVELLCVHAGIGIELAELRGCDETLRRVRTLVAEPEAAAHADTAREVGDVRIDLVRHEAFVRGVPVHLTPSEFRLLELLTEEPGRAYSREEIVERLWGTAAGGGARVADVHAGRLRRKLERHGREGTILESVRGVGYKVVPQLSGNGARG